MELATFDSESNRQRSHGFRHSESGPIPHDWYTIRAGDAVEANAPICYGVVQVGRHDSAGIPVVAIKYVKDISTAPLHKTSLQLEVPYARSRIKSGDVLISIKGTIGRVGVVPSGFNGNISRELARLRLRAGINPEYIAYQLEGARTQARISQAVVGTTRFEFSIAALRDFQLAIPPTESEQKAIAEALSDADALMESLSLLLAKKRQTKQGTMQELLTGKKRLPGFNGEWETRTIGELAELSKGVQLHGARSDHDGIVPHYNGGVSPSGYTDESNSPADTIVISEGGNSCGFVQMITQPFWCGGHCYAVIAKGCDKWFLFHALKAQQPAIMALRVGSGLPNIQKAAIRGFLIRHPSEKAEQVAIASILSEMDADVAALEEKLSKAHSVKQGMMQELLTGRIRLVQLSSNVIPLATKTAVANPPTVKHAHNWQINEAVVIAVLAERFGSERFPLPRKRRVKLMYLLHRHAEGTAEGYLKKAAGPYDPNTKYKGPEQIALKNGYVRALRNDKYEGFVAGDKIDQAQRYFEQWYGTGALDWLDRFHYRKTDDLELLATVDMAIVDLAATGEPVDVAGVKRVITANPEWVPKLSRGLFSDKNIASAIAECQSLFSG